MTPFPMLVRFGFGLMCFTLVQHQTLAHPASNVFLLSSDPPPSVSPLLFSDPALPNDLGGEPDHRRGGGGSRPGATCGQLAAADSALTALAPLYEQYQGGEASLVFGTTMAEHPTFWFYLPYSPPFTAIFTLWDSQGTLVYEGEVSLPQQLGVIQLTLPATLPALAPDTYHWYFKINCESDLVDYVDGLLQTLPPDPALSSQLENATPSERVALYAENGIWYEAIATAAELQDLNPVDPAWAALLEEVGLGAIAPAPVVDCCQWVSPSEPASD